MRTRIVLQMLGGVVLVGTLFLVDLLRQSARGQAGIARGQPTAGRGDVATARRPHRFGYLDNGVIRIGVDLEGGGAISYLADSRDRTNLVNINNFGAYVGQSYYSGPHPFGHPKPHRPSEDWSWNANTPGDTWHHPSRILVYKNDGTMIYVKCIPQQYALDDVPSECTCEQWIRLSGNTARVTNRLVMSRSDRTQYPAHDQEPAPAYGNGFLWNVVTYTGLRPFTNDALTHIDHYGPPPWKRFRATENWCALVNDANWGLGIHYPGTYTFLAGYDSQHHAEGIKKMRGGQYDLPVGYMSAVPAEILDWNITYVSRFTLIVGSLRDIREYAYAHRRGDTRPDYRFAEDRQHWYYRNAADTGWPIRGALQVRVKGQDPMMLGPEQWWSAKDVPKLYIRAAHRTKAKQARLFWLVPDKEGTGPERRIIIPVIADGRYHTYEVDLASHPNYRGTITGLRFDPINPGEPGDAVEVRYISWRNYEPEAGAASTGPPP